MKRSKFSSLVPISGSQPGAPSAISGTQAALVVANGRLAAAQPTTSKEPGLRAGSRQPPVLLSVVVLNYNGTQWLERCLESLRSQTLSEEIEVIVADNASPDSSNQLAQRVMEGWTRGRTLQLGANLGYSEGNNRAARDASGKYILFLNNDTWLEPDCLEQLLAGAQAAGAAVATPLVLDYASDTVQSTGWSGFDCFGFLSGPRRRTRRPEIFVASGCSLLVEAETFRALGGFDSEFFMYADEYDLCWRSWLVGGKVILVPSARVHHRGAAFVNPRGCQAVVESRTSDTKRFYANRNSLLVLLKNCHSFLFLAVLLQLLLLAAEALVMGLLAQRWSHIRRGYGEAVWDCWRLRSHIGSERRRLRRLRRHGDLWSLRFLRAGLNRWGELQRWRRFGLPKVDAR